MRTLIPFIVVVGLTAPLQAATLTVDDDGPADYTTIGAAVQAAQPGDIVSVADGTYRGPGNRGIDFQGKAITVISQNGPINCIMDCESKDRAFLFQSAETAQAVVEGFTLLNGQAGLGGAICCTNEASPTIRNCIIRDNWSSSRGGGIACYRDTSPTIVNCQILDNTSDYNGGGIDCYFATASLTDCTISGNTARGDGGALDLYYSQADMRDCTFSRNAVTSEGGAIQAYRGTLTALNCVFTDNRADYQGGAVSVDTASTAEITNCTFRGNTCESRGGGVFCYNGTTATITNSVFSDHTAHAIYRYFEADLTVRHCLFYANLPGDYWDYLEYETFTGGSRINMLSPQNTGNLSGNPRYAFPQDVRPLAGSPCIDNGTNEAFSHPRETDFDGNTRIRDGDGDGTAVADIGAFEFAPNTPAIAASPASPDFVKMIDGADPEPITLEIQNCGGGTLNWQLESTAGWLAFEPATGSCGEAINQVTLTADAEGLGQGLHQALLTIRDPQAVNSPRTLLVTLRVKGTRHVPGQYATIQEAIDAAMAGETVQVTPGTYEETLFLRKSVRLIGIDTPVLAPPEGASSAAVYIASDGCVVDGFRITGGYAGISVDSSKGNTIANNTITNTAVGIELYYESSGNTLLNNDIGFCHQVGLTINYSSQNTLRGNSVHDSVTNFSVYGYDPQEYIQDIDTSNTVDGKPIYYLVGEYNTVVDAASNAGCVVAVNCTNLTIADLTLTRNYDGVLLVNTSGSRIERVSAVQNRRSGIRLEGSANNALLDNTLTDGQYGIYLYESNNNTLQNNVMTDNTYHFTCEGYSREHYRQNINTSNRADGKPIFYLVDQTRRSVDRSARPACVYAVDCSEITVRDVTLEDNGVGVVFVYTNNSVIQDVTTRDNELAGIVMQAGSNNTVRNTTVSNSHDGMYIMSCERVRLDSDIISHNRRGVYAAYSQIDITNCYVVGNYESGGLAFDSQAEVTIGNCTIYGNTGEPYYYPQPAGVSVGWRCEASVKNTVIWANYPMQVYVEEPVQGAGVSVTYCDVQGGYEGTGNINADPMLTPDGHLRMGSPCIGGGQRRGTFPSYDIDGDPRIRQAGSHIGCDQYIDDDGDRLPNWWEFKYFGDNTLAAPDDDPDGDGHTNVTEYELYASDPGVPAAVYYVDAEQPDDAADGGSWETAKKTLQAAIDLSANSDKIYVAPGTYAEWVQTFGRQVAIQGVDIDDPDVVADTAITGILYFGGGEMAGCTVAGLTVSDGGVICSGSSPTIRNCLITENFAGDWDLGGGITLWGAAPLIDGCTISGNVAGNLGGGVLCRSSSPTLRHCLITGNVTGWGTGGSATALYAELSDVTIENCTIADNTVLTDARTFNSAIGCLGSDLYVTNSILWNHTPLEVQSEDSIVTITYSDIQGTEAAVQGLVEGIGNIAVDPCFVASGYWQTPPSYGARDWADGDYHLKSAGWRWAPTLIEGTHWVWDDVTSLCIDAGDPDAPLADEPMDVPFASDHVAGENRRINMGAYGGTRQASLPPAD